MLKNIILMFILMAITVSCASKKKEEKKPKKKEERTLNGEQAYALSQKSFIDSCFLTFAAMTNSPQIPPHIEQQCAEMFTRYLTGEIGIREEKANDI